MNHQQDLKLPATQRIYQPNSKEMHEYQTQRKFSVCGSQDVLFSAVLRPIKREND